ncbi:MAG: iron chelate uptake ABC transporter family permease subunit [Pelistega sp.]|nr:iron chelate uptake ABC transporter family permease subunit [Pelistega sp.]
MLWRLGGVGLLSLLFIMSLFVGVSDVSFVSIFTNPEALQVLLTSRLPRTLAIVLVGMSIANAGLIMQMLMRNRFVEPSMTGTTESAALGLLLVTLLLPESSLMTRMVFASALSIMGLLGFMSIVRRLPATESLLIPLTGIIYSGIIGAVGLFIAYETDMMQTLVGWMIGDFASVLAGRYELLWVTGLLCLLSFFFANQFTIAGLGKEISINLGLNHQQITYIGLVIIALIAAIVVVTIGGIPFIGLVVPNIVSRLMGDDVRKTLPWIMLSGAILVLVCDILSRLVNYPYEIPVGTVIGIVGSIIFLYLLYSRPHKNAKK